ncbi:hypothetical protein JY651_19670 [Pyxidicoccus parkwayensis]|uniref:Lipoprotein n=1 Tax=Pyxidicoccus parkwayensis TaxID=2813578 RepID=A0ABX7P927_9BACT|nr:hypothetical protein [Pyxidicoccus parkwaysis]QSQ26995.1 hypothetical protein JY651_19670 [Pyxidicoccus parkwaysis]
MNPDHYKVDLILFRPSWEGSVPPDCLAISPEVTATLDGQVMTSYAEGSGPALGGCTEPVFTLILPRSRYGTEGGNARFVLSDSSHTMSAVFEDFYVPQEEGTLSLPVLGCEGVAKCTGSGTR